MVTRKKVHIEFISKNSVILTTTYFQKKFNLKDDVVIIDISKLEECPDSDIEIVTINPPSSFFVVFFYDNLEDFYLGEVLAQTEENNIEAIGLVDYKKRNNKTFEVTIWTDDD